MLGKINLFITPCIDSICLSFFVIHVFVHVNVQVLMAVCVCQSLSACDVNSKAGKTINVTILRARQGFI